MRATRVVAVAVGCATVVAACATGPVGRGAARGFSLERDAFAFANESYFEFTTDPVTGTRVWGRRDPPPSFALHCAVMSRAARQFFLQARFDPTAPRVDDATYRDLVATVLARDPRAPASPDPVVIPGYAGLRDFSAAHADAMKAALITQWRAALPRGEWRLVFPFSLAQQARTADRLLTEVRAGAVPVVHALRYPSLALNHVLLVFDGEATPDEVRLRAYDPNDPTTPVTMTFDRTAQTFVYPPRAYFAGGPVKVFELYHGPLF